MHWKEWLHTLKMPDPENIKRCKRGHVNPKFVKRCVKCYVKIRKPRTLKK